METTRAKEAVASRLRGRTAALTIGGVLLLGWLVAPVARVHAGGCSGDSDCDGIPDEVEDGAPNGGDGNNDKEVDRNQNNVASYPVPVGAGTWPGYITLVVQSDCGGLFGVTPYVEEDMPVSDPDFDYPLGLVGFHVTCPNADVTFTYLPPKDLPRGGKSKLKPMSWGLPRHGKAHQAQEVEPSYRKFAPNPVPTSGPTGPSGPGLLPGPSFPEGSIWFTLEGAEVGTNSFSFHLSDGALGDDMAGDDEIRDPGGPGFPVVPVPALPPWGVLVMASALVGAGIWRVRREARG